MDFWTAIVVIVLCSLAFSFLTDWIKTNNKRSVKDLATRVAALEQKSSSGLEERVANLEKILTDPKTKLKEKIDEL